jgi:hypothetical protein
MTKKIFIISILVLLGVLSLGQKKQQEKKDISAYVVKVIRDVNMKSPTTGWQKAVPLSKLKSGYEVKTEKGSLAMILFADQSKLILREKSIVTIKGEVQGKEILSRSVHMDRGNMIFNVKKAETEQFRFSSPISVASIRGTEGGYQTGGAADYLTISAGLAEFTNSISGQSQNVSTGQTGIADSTGNMNVRNANKKELDLIQSGISEGEGQGETSTARGVVVSGTIAFEPSPTSGNTTTAKLDLGQTDTTISSVKLFYRTKGTTEYKELAMTLTEKIASVEIPAADVASPALEYYFVITIGTQSINLPSGGATSPGSVAVAKAISTTTSTGITITGTPTFNPTPVRSFINLQSSLDLSSALVNIDKVTLLYRRGGDATFKQLDLALSGKIASGTIPGIDIRAPGLDYYFIIKLKDTVGTTEVTFPADGASNPMDISVPPLTRIVPEFGQLISRSPGTVRVNFSSLQANVNAVSIFTRKQDEPTFTELILTPSGQVATGQLVADKVRFPKLEYYLSILFDDGSAVLVPQDGSTNPAATPVQSIKRELRVPGQTGSLQKKVIVLKWDE